MGSATASKVLLAALAGLVLGSTIAPASAVEVESLESKAVGLRLREKVRAHGTGGVRLEEDASLYFADGFRLFDEPQLTGRYHEAGGRKLALGLDDAGLQALAARIRNALPDLGPVVGLDVRMKLARNRRGTRAKLRLAARFSFFDPVDGRTRRGHYKLEGGGKIRHARRGLVPMPGGPVETEYQVVGDHVVAFGDIVFTLAEVRELEASAAEHGLEGASDPVLYSHFWADGAWPDGVVPFVVDRSLYRRGDWKTFRTRIEQAMSHWQQVTPIRFEQVDPDETDVYVRIQYEKGVCKASIGRRGEQPQGMWLSEGCSAGNIKHEIGHTVGLLHEHQRPDRDDWIEVYLDNVEEPTETSNPPANFDKMEGWTFSHTYDYGSIMHYPATAFLRDDLDPDEDATIEALHPLPPGVEMGQREGLSAGDKAAVRTLYGDEPPRSCDPESCPRLYGEGLWPAIQKDGARRFGDVDGDGHADMVVFGKTSIWADPGDVYVALARATGLQLVIRGGARTLRDQGTWLRDFCTAPEDVCELGDLNGDGRDDAVSISPASGEVWVAFSQEDRFAAPVRWHGSLAGQGVRFLLADFDGAYGTDVAAIDEDGRVYIATSTAGLPSVFSPAPDWSGNRSLCGAYDQCRTADVDGDGKDDLVVFRSDGALAFHRSLGNGSFESYAQVPGACPFDALCHMADMNSNAREDSIVIQERDAFGATGVRVNAYYWWDDSMRWNPLSSELFCTSADGCDVLDVDADGYADLLDVVDDDLGVAGFPRTGGEVWVSGAGRAEPLVALPGLGGVDPTTPEPDPGAVVPPGVLVLGLPTLPGLDF